MTILLGLLALLICGQWRCAREARRERARMMRPGTDWDSETVDRWLALIEPTALPDRPQAPRRR